MRQCTKERKTLETDIKINLNGYKNRLAISLNKKLELIKLQYEKIMSSKVFREPLLRIQEEYLKIDGALKIINDKMLNKYTESKYLLMNSISKLDSLKLVCYAKIINKLDEKMAVIYKKQFAKK